MVGGCAADFETADDVDLFWYSNTSHGCYQHMRWQEGWFVPTIVYYWKPTSDRLTWDLWHNSAVSHEEGRWTIQTKIRLHVVSYIYMWILYIHWRLWSESPVYTLKSDFLSPSPELSVPLMLHHLILTVSLVSRPSGLWQNILTSLLLSKPPAVCCDLWYGLFLFTRIGNSLPL